MTGSSDDDMGTAIDRVHQPGRYGQPAGYPLPVYNRSWAKADSLAEQGAAIAEPPRPLVAGCDDVLTCLVDDAAVEGVFRGPDGILAGGHSGATWIDPTREAVLVAAAV